MVNRIDAEQTHHLRKKVLRKGIENPVVSFDIDAEMETFHLGYFHEDELVGIVTVGRKAPFSSGLWNASNFSVGQEYQLRGMAVEPNFQGRGIGRILLDRVEKELNRASGKVLLWCHAREIAVNFYKKSNFKICSEVFDIPPIGRHYIMAKEI